MKDLAKLEASSRSSDEIKNCKLFFLLFNILFDGGVVGAGERGNGKFQTAETTADEMTGKESTKLNSNRPINKFPSCLHFSLASRLEYLREREMKWRMEVVGRIKFNEKPLAQRRNGWKLEFPFWQFFTTVKLQSLWQFLITEYDELSLGIHFSACVHLTLESSFCKEKKICVARFLLLFFFLEFFFIGV